MSPRNGLLRARMVGKANGSKAKMQRIAKCLVAAAICAAAGAHGVNGPFTGLSAHIEQAMTDWQVPGLAIVALHEGEAVFQGAFGVREAGKPEPVDLETVFALGSTGKAYTATLIGTLVDEGALSWDDPVADHLDYFRLPDPTISRMVTLRDLLSHRVAGDLGIGQLQLWSFTDLSRVAVLRRLRFLAVGPQRFRGAFQYGNPGFSAAGQAAGAAVGSTWDDLMRERILNAAGMQRASTTVQALWHPGHLAPCYMCGLERAPSHSEAKIANAAMPHVPTAQGPKPIAWRSLDNIGPAGSINSSVLDMAKFMQLHLNKGMIGGRRVVSEAAIAETHRPQILTPRVPYPASEGFGRIWTYGLGWRIAEYRGHKLVMHTGGITGWRSAIVMLPERSLGVALACNAHGAELRNLLAPALAFDLLDRALGLPPADHAGKWLRATQQALAETAAAERALRGLRNPDAGSSVDAARLAGIYRNAAFGELMIDPENQRVRLAGIIDGRLEHWHGDRYRITWTGPWASSHNLAVLANPSGGPPRVELQGYGVFSRD